MDKLENNTLNKILKSILFKIGLAISLAIISLSRGSNFLEDIGASNLIGWSILAILVFVPLIFELTKIQIAVTFIIFTLSQMSNMMINASNTGITDKMILLLLVVTMIMFIKKIRLKTRNQSEVNKMSTNANAKTNKTQNNKIRQRVIVEKKKTINKKEKSTKKKIGLVLIGIAVGATLILIGSNI